MDLSKGEKLLLIMLCDLYKQLSIRSDIDPDFVKDAIISRQTWGIEWVYANLLGAEAAPFPPVVKEVGDILDMWSFIKDSFAGLSEDEKDDVRDATSNLFVLSGDELFFPGFDIDTEKEHHAVAEFLINRLNMFPVMKSRSLASFAPCLETHRRMMDIFIPIRMEIRGRKLNAAELIELLTLQGQQQNVELEKVG